MSDLSMIRPADVQFMILNQDLSVGKYRFKDDRGVENYSDLLPYADNSDFRVKLRNVLAHGGTYIDVGFGKGVALRDAAIIKNKVGNGQVIGYGSRGHLDNFLQQGPQFGYECFSNGDVTIVEGNVIDVDSRDNGLLRTADITSCVFVLGYVPEQTNILLNKLNRITRIGGLVYVTPITVRQDPLSLSRFASLIEQGRIIVKEELLQTAGDDFKIYGDLVNKSAKSYSIAWYASEEDLFTDDIFVGVD